MPPRRRLAAAAQAAPTARFNVDPASTRLASAGLALDVLIVATIFFFYL